MPRPPKKSDKKSGASSSGAPSRQDRIAQMQREAKARERRNISMIWVALAAVLVLIGGLVTYAIVNGRSALDGVQEYAWGEGDLGHVNVRPEYATTPPAYGQHNGTWLNCGVYEEPVPDHHAVHSLEHGAIWLTYLPDLPESQIDTLRGIANQPDMLLSPYPGQDSPIVATAWGRQLFLDEPDTERIQAFIRAYMNDPSGPEPGGVCHSGTSVDLLPPPVEVPPADDTTETEAPADDATQTEAPGDEATQTE